MKNFHRLLNNSQRCNMCRWLGSNTLRISQDMPCIQGCSLSLKLGSPLYSTLMDTYTNNRGSQQAVRMEPRINSKKLADRNCSEGHHTLCRFLNPHLWCIQQDKYPNKYDSTGNNTSLKCKSSKLWVNFSKLYREIRINDKYCSTYFQCSQLDTQKRKSGRLLSRKILSDKSCMSISRRNLHKGFGMIHTFGWMFLHNKKKDKPKRTLGCVPDKNIDSPLDRLSKQSDLGSFSRAIHMASMHSTKYFHKMD